MQISGTFLFFLGVSPLIILFLLYLFAHVKLMFLTVRLRESVGKISIKEYNCLTRSFAAIDLSLFTFSRFIRSNDLEEYPQILQLKDEYRRSVKQLFYLFIALIFVFPLTALLTFLLTLILPMSGFKIT